MVMQSLTYLWIVIKLSLAYLYRDEVVPGLLVVDVGGHRDEAGQGVDGEAAVLVAARNGVLDLRVDAGVARGGQNADHVGAQRDTLRHGGKVKLARKLGRIVVHI